AATAPTSGTSCGSVANNCNEPTDTVATGLRLQGGSVSSAGDHAYSGATSSSHSTLWAKAPQGQGLTQH
ncbi:MAG: hypothetical protein IVW57_17620, partial [Ktedonobacterales bacterium]|nr:hypothetical protein [Ktedonobacterales bacterium]